MTTPKLIAALREENEKSLQRDLKSMESSKEKDPDTNTMNWYAKYYFTPAKGKKLLALPAPEAWQQVEEKLRDHHKKQLEKKIQQINKVMTAPDLIRANITVEWKKNQTWGHNPTATALIVGDHYETFIGKASGCGYDKESAAVAQALNQSNVILKALYLSAEYNLQNGGPAKNSHILGYGSGYSALPYYEGGVGVNCYRDYIKGFKFKKIAWGKSFDVYEITRTEEPSIFELLKD